MKKVLSILAVFFTVSISAFSVEFSFRMTPSIFFPESDKYNTGFSGMAQADINLLGLFTAGIEGGYTVVKPDSLENNIDITNAGLGLGAFICPVSRLYLGTGGAIGLYNWQTKINDNSESSSDLYYRFYGELGFRFNPSFTLSANGGYISYLIDKSDTLMSGPTAGISLKINLSSGGSDSGNITSFVNQDFPLLPVFANVYRTNPICELKIINSESAEIRNVHIKFRAGKYTTSAMEIAHFRQLRKFKTLTVPLMADFSPYLLTFSENGKLSGEIVVEYELLGKKKTSVQNIVLTVKNRNSFNWDTPHAISAFVSPDTPEVLEYAKYVAGIVRNGFTTGMSRNLQIACGMVEALKISGISYSEDTDTPYKTFHTSQEYDSIQFPLQTMNFLSGDYDDLGILLASCLESVGVETAFLPCDEDFLVLVSLDTKPSNANGHFSDTEKLILTDSNSFFALSMKELSKGFTQSRIAGGNAVKACAASTETEYNFIENHAAWEFFPPSMYSSNSDSLEKPAQSLLEKRTKAAIAEYISGELEQVILLARKSGNSNKLGVALVRAGRYQEAKAEFNKAAEKGSISAMNNVANIYMIEKNYSQAASQYKRVLQKEPENPIAKKGLETANSKLEY